MKINELMKKTCENCEHQYVNHKRCDLPFGVKCNSGTKWEQRKDVLSIFKEQTIILMIRLK